MLGKKSPARTGVIGVRSQFRPSALKCWSGRGDSNSRRPAWEIDCELKIQDNSVYGVNERRSKTPCFQWPAQKAPLMEQFWSRSQPRRRIDSTVRDSSCASGQLRRTEHHDA